MPDSHNQTLTFDGYRLDTESRTLSNPSGEALPLTPKVFDTLLYLVTNAGRVVGKDELLREVWADTIVEENNLSQNISILRRTFGEKPGERRYIETVAGKGFRFVPEVKAEDVGAPVTGESEIENTPPPKAQRDDRAAPNSSLWRFAAVAGVAVLVVVAGVSMWRRNSAGIGKVSSIAVLPFKPLVPGDGNPALELGMTDTLIWKMSGGEVDVRPLSSVRRFGSAEQDSIAAGRELGVDAVLDGSLSTAGDRIRIIAHLIRVADGKELWSGQFDDSFKDIFTVQDSISARVASELKVRLGGEQKKRYTDNAEAYQLYLKGRYLSQRAQISEIENSVNYFRQALDLDPNCAPAYVGLADAYRATVLIADAPPFEALANAKAAAAHAVSLDDSYAEAHAMLGWLNFWYDWDWASAEKELKRAIELDPASSDAHQFYAHLLSNTGRHDEALAEARRAIEIEPLSLRANSFLGMFLYHAGRYDEAVAQFRRTLDLDPNYRLALMFMSRTLAQMGRYDEAVAAARKVQGSSPNATEPITDAACSLALAGDRAEAANTLARFEAESARRYISPYNVALLHNALGRSDRALDNLARAYNEKDIRMVFLAVDPKWRSVRNDARFLELLKKMDLSAS
jgi:serine/threonine-protein kinase